MLLKVWKAGREERIVREVLVVVCRHVTVRAFSWVGDPLPFFVLQVYWGSRCRGLFGIRKRYYT